MTSASFCIFAETFIAAVMSSFAASVATTAPTTTVMSSIFPPSFFPVTADPAAAAKALNRPIGPDCFVLPAPPAFSAAASTAYGDSYSGSSACLRATAASCSDAARRAQRACAADGHHCRRGHLGNFVVEDVVEETVTARHHEVAGLNGELERLSIRGGVRVFRKRLVAELEGAVEIVLLSREAKTTSPLRTTRDPESPRLAALIFVPSHSMTTMVLAPGSLVAS